jgi:hypothetical protein
MALIGLVRPVPLEAQEAAEWFGVWHLDATESIYDPGPIPYRRGTWRIERADTDIKMVYDLIGVRGGVTHMEWTGRFDGQPYLLQGTDAVVAYAYTIVDPRNLDLVVTLDGVPAVRGRASLSPDGRTIVATTTSRNARGETLKTSTVYERR